MDYIQKNQAELNPSEEFTEWIEDAVLSQPTPTPPTCKAEAD